MLVSGVKDYAIFLLDTSGIILTWNAGAERIKGYLPEEIIGRHFSQFYLPEDLAADKPGRELIVAKAEGRYEEEGWRLRKDGSRFWANVVITALFDDAGRLQGFAKVTRDLSERKRTEEELRRSEERFRTLVGSVKDYAIFMLSPEGKIESWNAGAKNIKGYTAEEIIGQHFSVFYTPEDLRVDKPGRELVIAEAEGKYEEEGVRVRKDGSRFWASVLITALHSPDGQLMGFAKVTRDITERQQAQEELRQSEQRLKMRTAELAEVNQELDAFCYSVSHDLRAPLRAMQGFAQALREDFGQELQPAAQTYVERIVRASKRLQKLIEDLLDYSRLSRERLRLEPTDLQTVLDDALGQIGSDVAERQAVLSVAPNLGSVVAHPSTLVRVLANLISNAVKFVDRGPPVVRIYSEPRGERLRLWIEDNGIGIDPEHMPRIFGVFERLHGAESYPGTGIGLAIVRRAVERMGGTVGLESQLGAGSRFWIELVQPKGSKA